MGSRRTKKRGATGLIFFMIFILLVAASIYMFSFLEDNKETEKEELQERNFIEDITEPLSKEEDPMFLGKEAEGEENYLLPDITPETSRDGINMVPKPITIRAGYINPKTDFYKTGLESFEEVKIQIDESFESIKEMSFNTVIVGLQADEKVIYSSNSSGATESDYLRYITEKCQQEGIYSYALLEVKSLGFTNEKNDENNKVDSILKEVEHIVNSYKVNGVIFSDYDINNKKIEYAGYVNSGQGIGFKNYLNLSSESLVKKLHDSLKTTNPNIEIGLMVEPVWANKSTNDQGSNTKANYQQLYDGYADTKGYVEKGYADFVFLNNYYTTGDENTSFKEVASWWGKLLEESHKELLVLHSNDRVGGELKGWKEKEELANQVENLKEVPSYIGSAFNSLSQLKNDKTGSTEAFLETLLGKKDVPPVAKELEITNLESFEFITEEPNIIIRGSFDPKAPLYINGQEVSGDENGYFAYNTDLKVGINTYEFTHKEKTINISITKKIQIIKAVAPTGNITAEGGTKMAVEVIAYEGTQSIVASLGGQNITLLKGAATDGYGESSSEYTTFMGVFSLPKGTTEAQNLGSIEITASWSGITENITGGTVKINRVIPPTSIKDGKYVEILNTAETFSVLDTSDYSNPNSYPLPRGAVDRLASDLITYTEGDKTYSYYNLASGNRIYAESVKEIEGSSEQNNISKMTIKNDGRFTYVILYNSKRVSYKMESGNSDISINFIDTESVPGSMGNLTKNPMFSSAIWEGSNLVLRLRSIMTGITPYHEGKNLILRFNNPLPASSSLVVIDPGHSTVDPGALGFYPTINERELNVGVAQKVIEKLASSGVTTRVVPTTGKTSLQSRVLFGNNNSADLFVSIHHNSSPGSTAKGSEVYYFNPHSQGLASKIVNQISSYTGFINRGEKFGYFYVTRHQNYPSVLIECGFISTLSEYNQLILDTTQENISQGIVDGIIDYLDSRAVYSETGEESVGESQSISESSSSFESSKNDTLHPDQSESSNSESSSSYSSNSESSSSQSSNSESSSSQSSNSESSSSQSSNSESNSSEDNDLLIP